MATHDNTARPLRRQRPYLTDSAAKKLAASAIAKIHYDDTLSSFGLRVGGPRHGC
jgi:hypothetical protein